MSSFQSRFFIGGGQRTTKIDPGSDQRRNEVPEHEYQSRLSELQKQLLAIRSRHRHLWAYFDLGLVGLVSATILIFKLQIPFLWAFPGIALVLFSLRSLRHNARSHAQLQRLVGFYERGLARLQDKWQGAGPSGENLAPEGHPYARDLNLFGTGSLFEFLCTARTSIGERTLANWLLRGATEQQVQERQVAVAELRGRRDLQERWVAMDGSVTDHREAKGPEDWMNEPSVIIPRYAQALSVMLPVCFLFALSCYLAGLTNFVPIVLVLVSEALLGAFLLRRTQQVSESMVLPSFELSTIAPLLAELERSQFQSPLLKALKDRLRNGSGSPSRRIRRLMILGWLNDLRRSEYFALPSSAILWGSNLAILIERWKRRHRASVVEWLKCLGEFEALLCFARYHYENPDHTFPTVEGGATAIFNAESFGHPLLAARDCVRCDLCLETSGRQVLIVSGSNMSGKSTLLRSVGINAVLALSGAPVRAIHLRISSLQIGCSIGISDSLSDGKSRFLAEVERLRLILDFAHRESTLFLLDEMLAGTNSADRFIGARAIVEQLLTDGAIGLVTTHDLALAEIAAMNADKTDNLHFEERYENGEMLFDYSLRPGKLSRTNGRNIMAALGLIPAS